MKKIVVLAASNNNNMKLAESFVSEIKAQKADATLVDLTALNLPLYSNASEKEGVPDGVKEQADLLAGCDGFVAVAPEYNGSLPPTLNNFIAWVSRSGDDWRASFNGKRVAIGTHSGGGGSSRFNGHENAAFLCRGECSW